jgi:hypothetical protein
MIVSLLFGLFLQDPDPEAAKKEEAAKAAVSEFNAEMKKAKTKDEKIMAVQKANRAPHPLVLKELIKALKQDDLNVRKAVIFEIARYRKNKSAGEALVKQLPIEAAAAKQDATMMYAGHEMFLAVCQAISGIQYRAAAPALAPYFNHANLEVGKAAIRTAGELKSVETVDAMMAILREWTNAKVDDPYASSAPGSAPNGGSGFFVKHGNNTGQKTTMSSEQMGKIDKFNRKNQFPSTIFGALTSVSEQTLQSLPDCEKWWNANKAALLKEAKEKAKSGEDEEDE